MRNTPYPDRGVAKSSTVDRITNGVLWTRGGEMERPHTSVDYKFEWTW